MTSSLSLGNTKSCQQVYTEGLKIIQTESATPKQCRQSGPSEKIVQDGVVRRWIGKVHCMPGALNGSSDGVWDAVFKLVGDRMEHGRAPVAVQQKRGELECPEQGARERRHVHIERSAKFCVELGAEALERVPRLRRKEIVGASLSENAVEESPDPFFDIASPECSERRLHAISVEIVIEMTIGRYVP